MEKEKLHQELEHLHAQLQQIDSLDDSEREQLLSLAQDIRRILDYKGTDAGHYQGLIDRVRDTVTVFEAALHILAKKVGSCVRSIVTVM